MNQDKNEQSSNEQKSDNKQEHGIPNPFDPNDKRTISQEDLDNEEKFKEALTERD
jgi:hypothetical protein